MSTGGKSTDTGNVSSLVKGIRLVGNHSIKLLKLGFLKNLILL